VEQSFTRRGLLTVGKTRGPFSRAVLLEARATDAGGSPSSPDPEHLRGYEVWGLRVRYAGTPAETVSLADADTLGRRIEARIGGGE
jgi:hypothetical protein